MKRRIILEVEPTELFDKMVGDTNLQEAVGGRLVGALLVPTGFIDAMGLAFYGIVVVEDRDANS